MTNTQSAEEGASQNHKADASSPSLSEKQRRELWLYIAVSIVAVEVLIAVGAVLYSFITAPPKGADAPFVFPWMSWGAVAAIVPALMLLLVHLADVGLFRAPGGAASEQEWQKLLPERIQKIYRIVKGAPAVAVLVGVVLLGAALLTLDGALAALQRFGSALLPYLPHIIGGIAGIVVVAILTVAWLNYRTRRLIAEYEFRREVLEKTGVIIVDKGSTALPPGGIGDVPYAIVAGDSLEPQALPPSPVTPMTDESVEQQSDGQNPVSPGK